MLDTKENINQTIKEINDLIEQFHFTDEDIETHELDYLDEDLSPKSNEGKQDE